MFTTFRNKSVKKCKRSRIGLSNRRLPQNTSIGGEIGSEKRYVWEELIKEVTHTNRSIHFRATEVFLRSPLSPIYAMDFSERFVY